MNTDYLVSFIRVVEAGSFSKAAESMYISSPGLQQRVKKLEEDVGVQLLKRSPEGVSCTEAGKALYKASRPLVGRIEEIVGTVKRFHGAQSNILRIGMGKSFIAQWLLMACHDYSKMQPTALFRFIPCEFSRWIDDLATGLIDLCEFHGTPDDVPHPNDVELEVIEYEPLYACVFPDDPIARRPFVEVSDLHGRRLWIPETFWASRIMREIKEQAPDLEVDQTYLSALKRFEEAIAGCVSIAEESYVATYAPLVGVRIVGLDPVPIGLAYRKSPSGPVENFVAYARNNRRHKHG